METCKRTSFFVLGPYLVIWLGILLSPCASWGQNATNADTVAAPAEDLMTDREVFDRDRLLEVEIQIAEADWDELRMQSRNFATALMKPPPPSPYTWFKADVTINGHRLDSVGVRKKGFLGSQDTERPSLKIKFDEFTEQDPIAGVDRLTLNNNKQDRGFVSQALTYQLFADAKLPASRCSLAKVTVNGELLGIYSNVESLKKPMLVRHFGDADGKLYEGTVADLITDNIDALEAKQVGADDKRVELLELAELVGGEGELDIAAVEKSLAIDEFLKFWALESLIGFWDGYTNNQNNYYVYYHSGDSKLHFMPWGADAAFSYEGAAKMFKNGPESVHGQSYVANRLYHADGMADRYRDTMLGLLEEVWDEASLIKEIDRLERLVDGHIHDSQMDCENAMEQSREFVKSRRKLVQKELDDWPQEIKAKPRKPFYSANIGTAVGKFTAKWMEKDPSEPYDVGEAELELTLEGKPVKFLRLGVHAIRSKQRGMDGKKAPTVVFIGKRETNKIRVTFAVGTEEDAFTEASGEPVGAMGVLLEGAWFGGNYKMVGGTMTLDEAGTEVGDTVRGTLKANVVEFKGGMR